VFELPDGQATIWCKNIPEKLNPLSRVHARHRRQTDRQTDRWIYHAKRNVVSHVWLKMQDSENCNKTAVAQHNFCKKNFDAYSLITNTELVIQSKSKVYFSHRICSECPPRADTQARIDVHATVELLR